MNQSQPFNIEMMSWRICGRVGRCESWRFSRELRGAYCWVSRWVCGSCYNLKYFLNLHFTKYEHKMFLSNSNKDTQLLPRTNWILFCQNLLMKQKAAPFGQGWKNKNIRQNSASLLSQDLEESEAVNFKIFIKIVGICRKFRDNTCILWFEATALWEEYHWVCSFNTTNLDFRSSGLVKEICPTLASCPKKYQKTHLCNRLPHH